MKFFYKCAAIFVGVWAITTISDQLIFEPHHTLSASFLFGMTLAVILVVIFGGFLEVYVNHHPGV